jgi:hypothetical protein
MREDSKIFLTLGLLFIFFLIVIFILKGYNTNKIQDNYTINNLTQVELNYTVINNSERNLGFVVDEIVRVNSTKFCVESKEINICYPISMFGDTYDWVYNPDSGYRVHFQQQKKTRVFIINENKKSNPDITFGTTIKSV